jgi:ComF family protein
MNLLEAGHLRIVGRLLGRLVELCYPGVCAVCQRLCDRAGHLCDACEQELAGLEAAARCQRCAKPVAQRAAPCPWCVGRGVHPFERIECLGVYQEPLSTLIRQMKFGRRWPLGEILADRLVRTQAAKIMLDRAERLVAVPLHYRRQLARGYNQAEVIAGELARRCRVRVGRPVARIRNTPSQTQLRSRIARANNVRDAFALVHARGIRNKHVVVVDDVMTSGATLQAVGRTLLQVQPASLCAIVLAVADPRGRDFQAI